MMIEPVVRPNTIDEVIIKKEQVVSGTVTVPVGNTDGLVFGTALTTANGGETWNSQTRNIYVAGTFAVDDEVFHNNHSWKSLEADNLVEPGTDETKWQDLGAFDANGILGENITGTSKVSVLVTGAVRAKYLSGFDASMKHSLFTNKIILR